MNNLQNDKEKKSKLTFLLQRMIHLLKLIPTKISLADLKLISELGTADLADKAMDLLLDKLPDEPINNSLKKLFIILTDEEVANYIIADAKKLEEVLWDFEKNHGDYLNLLPLCVANKQTTANSLNDFACFYLVFIKHVQLEEIKIDKNNSKYVLNFNHIEAKTTWHHWKKTRPLRLATEVEYTATNNLGLIEKFLAGILKDEEWLNDKDLERGLRLLGINDQVHVIPFNVQDLGTIFHFAREEHQKDDPKKPYYISLILNLGEDEHSRIDDQGKHWVKMFVKVDPTTNTPSLSINYEDSLFLNKDRHVEIENIIRNAISYRENINNEPGINAKFYTAYPDYAPTISITGSAEQNDGFSCGYRAIAGILQDLITVKEIVPNPIQLECTKCDNAYQLRDFLYIKFLCEQKFTQEQFDRIKQNNFYKKAEKAFVYDGINKTYAIAESIIKGQLYAFICQEKPTYVDPDKLKIFAEQSSLLNDIYKHGTIQDILRFNQSYYELPINKLIQKLSSKNTEVEIAAIINAIFKALNENPKITKINIVDCVGLSVPVMQLIIKELDYSAKFQVVLSDDNKLDEYASAIYKRNVYLKEYYQKQTKTKDPWSYLFENMISQIPDDPGSNKLDLLFSLGKIGFTKFIKFIKENGEKITNYNIGKMTLDFKTVDLDLEYIDIFKNGLSESSYLPFNKIVFHITNENLLMKDFLPKIKELLLVLMPLAVEEIKIYLSDANELTVTQVEDLIGFAKKEPLTTALAIRTEKKENTHLLEKLMLLENTIVENRRKSKLSNLSLENVVSDSEIAKMGKIGKAILGINSLDNLNTNSQIQQQQQMQQQIQKAVDDSNLDDENQIPPEHFFSHSSNEELIDRKNIRGKLGEFIFNRYGHPLSPEMCWDYIVGESAEFFKYGIKKITISAAKKLIDNLKDVRYGLDLDNRPRGFDIEEKNGEVILSYNSYSPRINANESPLTPQFVKPLVGSHWIGNMEQFLPLEEIQKIYHENFGPIRDKFSLQDCIQNFFYLKNIQNNRITIEDREKILAAVINYHDPSKKLFLELQTLFNNQFTVQNISALFEILYSFGINGLQKFLEKIKLLKAKGDDFFNSFRNCFINPSENLCELLADDSVDAIEKLSSFSKEELAWWQDLSEQHAIARHFEKNELSVTRWSCLSNLVASFIYFHQQLLEIQPDCKLPLNCPIKHMFDMHAGLFRLLCILRRAHDFDEQFYALKDLSLQPLGPYYAVRYEGFKIVTDEMRLKLGSIEGGENIHDEIKCCKDGFSYRLDKKRGQMKFTDPLNSASANNAIGLAYYLRYLATFNHRAPLNVYQDAFAIVTHEAFFTNFYDRISVSDGILKLIVHHGVGKFGKNFNLNEFNNFIHLLSDLNVDVVLPYIFKFQNLPKYENLLSFLHLNLILKIFYIKNSQIIHNSDILNSLAVLFDKFHTIFTVSLETYIQNKYPLYIFNIVKYMSINETHIKRHQAAFFKDDLFIRANLSHVLVRLKSDNHPENEILKIENLYKQIEIFNGKNGKELAHELVILLASMDLASEVLPTLDDLTQVIIKLNNEVALDSHSLLSKLTAELPETTIVIKARAETNQVTGGDLYTIISKHMEKIITELTPKKDMINMLGDGFFETLKTSEGPRILLHELQRVKEYSGMMGDVVQGQIKSLMLVVYEEVKNSFAARISADSRELYQVFLARINHPIKKNDNDKFTDFCDLYPTEIKYLEKTLSSLDIITRKWSKDFSHILSILVDQNSSIQHYNMELIANIITSFANNFSEKNPFPIIAFTKIFHIKNYSKALENITRLINTLFNDEESKKWNLTEIEKEKLCLVLCDFLTISPNSDIFDEFIKKLSYLKLQFPECFEKVLDLFIHNQPQDFLAISISLAKISSAEILKNILFILEKISAQQAAQKPPIEIMQLPDLLAKLNNISYDQLTQIVELYSLATYPTSQDLLNLVDKGFDETIFTTLQTKFGGDPGTRSDEVFSEENVSDLIERMVDINHNRPLPHSKRQKLYRWFLYINAIAKDHGIRVNPENLNSDFLKPVKDLTCSEIKRLYIYYKKLIQDKNTSTEKRLTAQLEFIAIAREVMFRTTGNFPWPTQILYLLAGLQNSDNFVGQIQTGQGKSLTAALTAAMLSLEGQTIDVCSSDLFLAGEGLDGHQHFFDYLGIKAKLITSDSKACDYVAGGIHYSSMEELALFRAKTELHGKSFSTESALIVDESDYSILDQKNRFCFAINFDPTSNPLESPYTWIYEELISFVDDKRTQLSLTDEAYLELAEKYLWQRAENKNKSQRDLLKNLAATPEIFKQRLEIWLIAAGKTANLIKSIEDQYRVVTPLKDLKYDIEFSKACLLKGKRPDIESEFSDAIQQFLHVRLRHQYSGDLKDKKMSEFLVEPEKTYVASYNSNILIKGYKKHWGMTGTAGSKQEIQEQQQKYGFKFVEIPPYQTNLRVDLDPILTNAKFLSDQDKENSDHIDKIVKEILAYIALQKSNQLAGPVLILCKNVTIGNQIYGELRNQFAANPLKYQGKYHNIQQYYGSSKPTATERKNEEREIVKSAAKNGMITISSVFGRGTDIKPDHTNGLYVVQAYINTDPAAEDLERAKRQIIGRAGRKGQSGQSRLIVKRSEFSEVYSHQELKAMTENRDSLEKSIKKLNFLKNQSRTNNREVREAFDNLKDIFYQKFLLFINTINDPMVASMDISSQEIEMQLFKTWNNFLIKIDNQWLDLQGTSENVSENIDETVAFAIKEWSETTGLITKMLNTWINKNILGLVKLPDISDIQLHAETVLKHIYSRYPTLPLHYTKSKERLTKLDSSLSQKEVYCDFAKLDNNSPLKKEVTLEKLKRVYHSLTTVAYQKKLHHLKLCQDHFEGATLTNHTKEMAAAYLYLQYQAYREGNSLAYALLHRRYQELVKTIKWSQDPQLINALIQAQMEHYKILSLHQGNKETQKSVYLKLFMSELLEEFPQETKQWQLDQSQTLLKNNQTQWIQCLTDYRDQWWSRSWVSDDRKAIVNNLISQFTASNTDAESLIQALNTARLTLLNDDRKNNRSMQAGLEGRLNHFIDAARNRIYSMCTPETLDSLINLEFSDSEKVLENFKLQFAKQNIATPALSMMLQDLKNKSSIEEKYQTLLHFFADIESRAINEKFINGDDFKSLYRYCQNKRNDLIHYFSQCDKYGKLPLTDPVGVYRAISQAASNHVNNLLATDVDCKKQPMPENFSYMNYEIVFKNNLAANDLSKNRLFSLIHHSQSYINLLFELEKAIVEKRKEETIVIFKELILSKSEQGFKLAIELTVNNKLTNIDLDFNTHLGTVYYNEKDIFKNLLVPELKVENVSMSVKNPATFFQSKNDKNFVEVEAESLKSKFLRWIS